ncbi:unnamed protein product [Cylicocyclus nassatus]|uniref:MADF domain-containing protein n=1 Tax=Cylicocyclus nassatus TaxID=53992 RepID=A0AA36DRM5_CYLNA|nr:unnamed protein product [Cylicocyclus nassatus]
MAWRLVCEEMSEKFGRQYDSKLLQKCFKNLRDTYVHKRREYEDVIRKRIGLESGILEKITSWPFFANLRFIDPPVDDEEIVEVVEELDSIEPKRKFVQKRECAIAISKPKTALVPSSKKLERKTKEKDTVDQITSVLENLETPDRFESTGQALSAKLREIIDWINSLLRSISSNLMRYRCRCLVPFMTSKGQERNDLA